MSSTSNFFSFIGWTFLPDLCTNYLQSFYYAFTVRAGDHKPQPGSPLFVRDRRRIYCAVIIVYLLYTVYEAHWEIRRQGDFYSILGVPYNADDRAIQTSFRRWNVNFHPDKVSDPALRPAAEAFFVRLSLARDTLLDPAKRFAYDRFGPESTSWRHCVTIREYTQTGLMKTLPLYLGAATVLVVLQLLGTLGYGAYWRYLALASLALFELRTLTRPTIAPVLPQFLQAYTPPGALHDALVRAAASPTYLPFQLLQLAHRGIFAFFIALARLGPLVEHMATATPLNPNGVASDADTARQFQALEQQLAFTSLEAARLLALDTVPFGTAATNPSASGNVSSGVGAQPLAWSPASSVSLVDLKGKIKDWMVNNTVRNDPEVVDAVKRVVLRRREGQLQSHVEHEHEHGHGS